MLQKASQRSEGVLSRRSGECASEDQPSRVREWVWERVIHEWCRRQWWNSTPRVGRLGWVCVCICKRTTGSGWTDSSRKSLTYECKCVCVTSERANRKPRSLAGLVRLNPADARCWVSAEEMFQSRGTRPCVWSPGTLNKFGDQSKPFIVRVTRDCSSESYKYRVTNLRIFMRKTRASRVILIHS